MEKTLDLAVLCFAGPVIGKTVSMLNWSEPRIIHQDDLAVLGLSKVNLLLLNDMDAAAYGLAA